MGIKNHPCENFIPKIGAGLAVCAVCGNIFLSTLSDHKDQIALDKVAPHGFEQQLRRAPDESMLTRFVTEGTAPSSLASTQYPHQGPYQGRAHPLT